MVDNRILIENQKPGTPKSVWDAPATNQIEGFATDISTNHGGDVSFKINLNVGQTQTAPYHIEIYRLGYYGGDGATLVTTLSGLTGRAQPNPITDSRGVTDAGNWSVSATWHSPSTAVSGVYLAKLVRDDNGATNQIPFIIRDDSSHSDIILQTDDTTWQAYNGWAGRNGQVGGSLYGGFNQPDGLAADPNPLDYDRAFGVSYDRPIITRDGGGTYAGAQDYLFGATYSAISFLEKNGYDVTYMSGVDTARLGAANIEQHKAYISVGHDEYWSGDQRANVEAARDAGTNLLFWSGNEVYWKTRWENSIVDGTSYRTLVSYKESRFNNSDDAQPQDYANVDPNNQWTGLWRDTRFVDSVNSSGVHTAVGAKPDSLLSGQSSLGDGTGQFGAGIDVPASMAGLRVWRDTGVGPNGATDIAPGIIGYEWDTSPTDSSRPAGLIKLSDTSVPWEDLISHNGNSEAPGTGEHSITLYRAPSGALVFGAGTVFWSWGLSNEHDSSPYGANIASTALQQFTVNMFADIGIQPAVADSFLQNEGLVRASASTDATAARAAFSSVPDTVGALQQVTISGTATDTGGKVAAVEVSTDGGQSWLVANGTSNWNFSWLASTPGTYTVEARAIDDSLNLPTGTAIATHTVTVTAPVRPSTFSLFGTGVTPTGTLSNDGQQVELGMKFQAAEAGSVTALRYWRAAADANDTDTRAGHLWSSSGTLLGTVTFTSTSGQSGWQTATLSSPVTLQAGQTYIVSYHTADNYLSANNYFTNAVSDPFNELTAPASGASGGNGVYLYGSALAVPNQTFAASNYWVDVVFAPTSSGSGAPSTPDLLATSDSGASSTDNLTNDTTPTLVGTAAAGATIRINEGATLRGTGTADAGGNWSITTQALGEGSHVLTATATVGGTTSPPSGSLTVNIDTTAPTAPSTPDMTVASDDGASSTDNVTSIATPTFTGTVANAPGATVTLREGSVALGTGVVDASGVWSVTSTALGVGNHTITAVATDAAGNTSTVSGGLAVTILTPTTPSSVSLFGPSVTPSGTANNDGGAVELGMKFSASTGGSVTQLRYWRTTADANDTDTRTGHLWSSGGTLLGTVTFTSTPGQSGWQVATLSTPVTLTAGTTYVVSYKTADNYLAAGNYFASTVTESSGVLSAPSSASSGGNGVYAYGSATTFPAQTFNASNYWVDVVFTPTGGTGAPGAPSTPDLLAASDSGFSSTDNLTNDATPTLTGTALAGATVRILDGSTQVGTGTADGGGAWSITTQALGAGPHTLTATATTSGGTSAPSAGLAVTIDTTPPAAPGTPDMTAASDNGGSNTDNSTSITTPTFTGTALNETGAFVTLREGATVLGTSAISGGTWTITSTALGVGNHSITAVTTDAAGNTGPVSGALAVTITSGGAPAAPSTPDLTAASDSGSSSTDNRTNDTTPTLVGTAVAGATVTLSEGATVRGTATADANGNWSITTGALANGAHTLTATATTAGGTSAASGGLTVTIDTAAPAAPGTPDMTAASDNGGSNTDNSTSITTPTFTGVLAGETGALVTLREGATSLGAATVDASGNWSITSSALSVGNHSITAVATDVAGNTGPASGALAVSIVAAGGQTLTGTAGANTLSGGAGADSISGLGGGDSLSGAGANDTLSGGNGADTLNGGDGADVLIGGTGLDSLTGGAGDDIFRYTTIGESNSGARDVILDFQGAGAAGGDVIDVSALAGTYAFNGTGAFSGGGVPSIRYAVTGGVTDVMFDDGGGGAAEMVVRINSVVTLSSGDFLL